MIIDCISDLHGHYPELDGGDLLFVAGDFTARDTEREHVLFCHWLSNLPYRKKIIVAGNHHNGWVGQVAHKGPDPINPNYEWYEYLCDSGTEFEGLKIWGSPWSRTFEGMNPHCKAFTKDTDEELAEKWELIPKDIDILITHSPPMYLMDLVERGPYPVNVGSASLANKIKEMDHILHVFGHIHEGYGYEELTRNSDGHIYKICNASHVNEYYKPVNKPIRVIL